MGLRMADILEALRSAFDGKDVVRKSIALQQAHDEIARLRAALRSLRVFPNATEAQQLADELRSRDAG